LAHFINLAISLSVQMRKQPFSAKRLLVITHRFVFAEVLLKKRLGLSHYNGNRKCRFVQFETVEILICYELKVVSLSEFIKSAVCLR
jgi:hypothetical protein